MSLFNSKKRVGIQEVVPEKPLVPYIEVKRSGLLRYDIRLTPHPDYPYTNWRGREEYYIHWTAFGSKAHAEAYAKRIINRYLRRVSYRNGVTLRIHGKID